jgi:hypothetical protein
MIQSNPSPLTRQNVLAGVKVGFDPHYFPSFDAPEPRQRFSDVMYAVSGRTRVENHLITIARDELLTCLLADERVISRLNRTT